MKALTCLLQTCNFPGNTLLTWEGHGRPQKEAHVEKGARQIRLRPHAKAKRLMGKYWL